MDIDRVRALTARLNGGSLTLLQLRDMPMRELTAQLGPPGGRGLATGMCLVWSAAGQGLHLFIGGSRDGQRQSITLICPSSGITTPGALAIVGVREEDQPNPPRVAGDQRVWEWWPGIGRLTIEWRESTLTIDLHLPAPGDGGTRIPSHVLRAA